MTLLPWCGWPAMLPPSISATPCRWPPEGRGGASRGPPAPGPERYRGCWRWELEAKGGMALPLAIAVNERSDRAAYVQAYVHGWAMAHGITPTWEPLGSQELIPGFRRRSDADTRLA